MSMPTPFQIRREAGLMTDQTHNHRWHRHLSLTNFTAFKECRIEFGPGINAFVGENGTGKTHAMKALYAIQLALARPGANEHNLTSTAAHGVRPVLELSAEGANPETRLPSAIPILYDLFQTKSALDIVRAGAVDRTARVKGTYGNINWEYSLGAISGTSTGGGLRAERPVFIPAIDMIGHSKGFVEADREVGLDFDLTCLDIVTLLRLERKSGHNGNTAIDALAQLLSGGIEKDDDGRFYLATNAGRMPMPMVAEGLRKIATLVQLHRNGWLPPGATLFWDEPEVNLNPVLMDEVVAALLALARSGVQIFLATHSYVILKELDLQTEKGDEVRYFAFQRGDDGTTVNATDDFSQLQPNAILEQYDSLYDRELTRSTGRNRRGERVG
jgi:hypothetical protein